MTRQSKKSRIGITLLEIVLAMGLSSMLLYAVGMAMDLHFRALDVQRTRVERSQVARAVLRHISDDVRSAMQQMPVDLEGLKEAAKNQKAAQSMVMTALAGEPGQAGNGQGGSSGNSGSNGGPRGGGQSGGGGQGGAPSGGIPGGGDIPALPPGFDPSSIPGGTLPPGVSLPPGFNAGNLQAAAAAVGGGLPGANNPGSSSPSSGGQGGAGAGGAGGGRGGMGAGQAGGSGQGGGGRGGGRGGQGGQGGQGQGGQGGGQRGGSGGSQGGSKSGSGGSSRGGASGGGASAGGGSGAGGAGGSGGSMQLSGMPSEENEEDAGPATIVGLFGSATQLQFDISRLPRLDQYTSADGQVPSDIQTVIYYLGSLASTTGGVADTSAAASGLMRVQRERAATSFAESSGDSSSSYAGGKLIASEVAGVQFRYFSGEEWLESWDSDEQGGLPLAVEAEIMLADLDYEVAQTMLNGSGTGTGTNTKTTEPQMYKMVIPIPVAKPGANLPEETAEGMEEEESTGAGSSGSSSSGSP